MNIPKIIEKKVDKGYIRKYEFVHAYNNYFLYEDIETKCKTCFRADEIGLIPKRIKDRSGIHRSFNDMM